MRIILHNDDTLHGFDSARTLAEEVLHKEIKGRMREMLTRVEIWVADENADKGGPDDKRCTMEAHPRGRKPVGVQARAADIPAALCAAAKKLARALGRELRLGVVRK